MTIDQIRENFPITRNYNFQNHAAVSPLCRPAAEALAGYGRELSEAAYLRGTYYRAAERVRQLAARLINAHPSEVTFIKNTCEGINYVANGIQWITGDNVVSTAMEFHANVYPWMNLESRGVGLKRVADEDGRIPFDRIAAAIDKRTRLVAISAVQWSNGFRIDLTRLGELCLEKGVLLFVDAIQALGVHPLDVRAMHVDFHDDARRFDSGVYNLAGICALGASIQFLLELGLDTVQHRVKENTDVLVEGLRSKGWKVHSPRTASEWSGIVSFSSERHDNDELRKHLRNEFKIILANRLGRLRASPHFYNTTEEMRQLVEALPPG
jgi:cysteine desulfurase/selenocysteine lyase